MRGFAIAPTRNEGDRRYYFRSDRAPRKDRGEWIVSVLKVEPGDPGDGGDPGGGDPGGGGGSLLPPPPLNNTRLRFVFGSYIRRGHDFYPGESGLVNTWPFVDGTLWNESNGGVNGTVRYNIYSFDGSYDPELEQYYINVFSHRYNQADAQASAVFNFVNYANPGDELTFTLLRLQVGNVVVFDALADPESADGDRPGKPIPSDLFDTTKPPHDYSTPPPQSEPEPEPEPEPTPPEVPDGWVSATGKWAYQCTCPDFTGEEHPYNVPLAPSQFRQRSWSGGGWKGMYGTQNFPCKHVVSVGYKRQDWYNIFSWARAAAKDLPARELWQQALDSYREYRARLSADREAQRRERQEQIDQRVRDKAFREDSIDRVFQGRDLGIQDTPEHRPKLKNGRHMVAGDQLLQEQEENIADLERDRARRRRPWNERRYHEGQGTIYIDAGRGREATDSIADRLDYTMNTLSRIDEAAKFIANEGAKYGWGGQVTGNDPFSPIREDL